MESTPEEAAEGLAIVRVLAAVLDRLVCANSPLARTEPGQITKFHALKAPGIGIQQYLERIHKYASCSSQCFIMALIYIDRLIQRNGFLLTELNVHRVIVTAVLLAAKFFDDAYYNNAYYAKVGGVLVSEMNGLEVDFLFRINFSLHVSPELFDQYRAELLSHSGVESISLQPPPSPQQFGMDQHMAAVPQQHHQHESLHHQQTLQQQQHNQAMQQQAAMCNVNPVIGGYHHMTSGQHQHVPHQITPSPTRPSNGATSSMPMTTAAIAVVQAVKQQQDDEMMAAAVDQAVRANLPNMFAQEFSFLQRANSLPVQTKSLVNQVQMAQAGQPLSAPAMMAMVPGVVNPNFPSLMDAAAVVAAAGSSDPLVMMSDNQFYQVPNLQHHNHNGNQQRHVMDASDLIHHVHHHPSVASHHVPGFVSREASVSQRFASGQMVAGVSGGL